MSDAGLPPRYQALQTYAHTGRSRTLRARDRKSGQEVVVKLFDPQGSPCSRAWREAAILSQIRHPGVVPLLDEGRIGAVDFLVTPHLDGSPFPGRRPLRAGELERLARTLGDTLAHVHACGVVHGDLKPDNVLVDDDGHCTLIDFDLSPLPHDDLMSTPAGGLTGSMATMSPEQLRGARATAACDCYALGVMLFKAATSCWPHPLESRAALMRARLASPSVALSPLAIPIADELQTAIEGLMHAEPHRRFAHLDALVARAFTSESDALTALWLRASGLNKLIPTLAAPARQTLCGEPSLHPDDLHAMLRVALTMRGPLFELLQGSLPFESLPPAWLEDIPDTLPLEEVHRVCLERLKTHLHHTPALVRRAHLDAWSLQLIDELPADLPLIEMCDEGPATHTLCAPGPAELEVLFEGSNRIFGVPHRAAALLARRSAGRLGGMAALLQLWRRQGMGSWKGSRFAMSLAALEHLEAQSTLASHLPPAPEALSEPDVELLRWVQIAGESATLPRLALWLGQPGWSVRARLNALHTRRLLHLDSDEAVHARVSLIGAMEPAALKPYHRAVAEEMEPGQASRFFHMLRYASDEVIAAEGLRTAEALDDQGRSDEAIAVLRHSLRAALLTDNAEAITRVLETWAAQALASASPTRKEAWLANVERLPAHLSEPLSRLIELVALARHCCRARAADTIAPLHALGPFASPRLELRRQMFIARACKDLSIEAFADALDAMRPWAGTHSDAEVRGSFVGWQAMLAFHRHDFKRAANLHARAAQIKTRPSARQASLLAEAIARMEAGDFERSHTLARALITEAHAPHQPHHLARIHNLIRTNAYRLGEPLGPEPERVDELAMLAIPELRALTALTEAAIAWRAGENPLARSLCEVAREDWEKSGHRPGADLARTFSAFLHPGDPHTALALAASLHTHAPPRIALQGFAMLATSLSPTPYPWQEAAHRCLRELPDTPRHRRMEILSVDECLRLLESSRATERSFRAPPPGLTSAPAEA
ncbi:serine/threonine protein kinase [Bradymonadaceae bacterium TMQ3]|nr:serine/threonine protein kinase [Bradymonadaceae bacterium TMQ3]TXC73047.1 serine/threonine protein kinase [Bradymonadales bacterium TMQ1]